MGAEGALSGERSEPNQLGVLKYEQFWEHFEAICKAISKKLEQCTIINIRLIIFILRVYSTLQINQTLYNAHNLTFHINDYLEIHESEY